MAAAGFFRRLGALVYDTLIVAALAYVVAMLSYFFSDSANSPITHMIIGIAVFGYFAWFWTHGGQTIGMLAWKIRLVSATEGPVNLFQALMRFFSAIISIGLLLGLLWIVISKQKLAWHDSLSETKVITVKPNADA